MEKFELKKSKENTLSLKDKIDILDKLTQSVSRRFDQSNRY